MNVIKVIVDDKPKDCSMCQLNTLHRRNCGKERCIKSISGVTVNKKPDNRCKLITTKE